MTAEECIKLLREIKDVAFATVDKEGHPQVRIIDVMIAEGEKLYFCTERGKDFYRQLMANEYTAITGMNKEFQMVRLSGPVKKLSDQKMWIDRIFEENPMMNDVYPGESIGCGTCRDVCPQQCISEGKPYKIQQEHCLHCGLCKEQCPAGAIQRKDG